MRSSDCSAGLWKGLDPGMLSSHMFHLLYSWTLLLESFSKQRIFCFLMQRLQTKTSFAHGNSILKGWLHRVLPEVKFLIYIIWRSFKASQQSQQSEKWKWMQAIPKQQNCGCNVIILSNGTRLHAIGIVLSEAIISCMRTDKYVLHLFLGVQNVQRLCGPSSSAARLSSPPCASSVSLA